jgi:hypothetical protein
MIRVIRSEDRRYDVDETVMKERDSHPYILQRAELRRAIKENDYYVTYRIGGPESLTPPMDAELRLVRVGRTLKQIDIGCQSFVGPQARKLRDWALGR